MLDFFCAPARLCVEIDGWAHGMGERPERDERRDLYLREQGIQVERIAAKTVLEDPAAVATWMRQLALELAERPLSQLR